ncbi:Titin [Larimichthys crocea]|uniref:B-cell receptor CD22 n=1 Tax=Larimichthys crocea TaxID=215358 RepID=A0A6G0J9W2_LARCR|nr:Titin [Larimichthys crocea]
MQDNRPVDLRTNPEYAGRLKYYCDRMACTLRITDLRESDSAEYKFRFKDKEDRKFTGSPGVTLSVAGPDLHVQVRRLYSTWAELFCHTTCHLPERPAYIWYKNGQTIKGETSFSYSDYLDPADSYACAVTKYEDFPAPSVCVSDQTCNRVTYTDRSICASKGSSVDISCTYNSYDGSITSKFWFSPERSDQWQSPSQPEDLSEDSLNAGRVQVLETERGRSTLRIRDLRESDSAQYHFKFKTSSFEWRSILPGTTLTVTALQVRLIRITIYQNYTEADLMCHSSCSPSGHFSFVWFKNGQKIKEEMPAYTEDFYPGDSISCAFKGHEDSRSLSVYAPQFVSVLVSPSSECTTGSSVTLTCSSDAHPAAKYTWYKKNGDPDPQPLSKEAELVFRSIQSSDSGEYYCTAENELGRRTSESISVNVKYPPKLPSVSVSPSAEIVENSSVNLTCSSDANPAAKYTWYKEKQKLPQRSTGIYHFTSISSEDRGNYYCKSENQHGEIDSSSLFIDVQYAPKLPSVSVSPSAEIVENSSVTLTCSSDANPAAKYTWYKENEDSPKASGQIFTITDFRPEHRGNYYCEAQNRRGRHNSTLHLIVVAALQVQVKTISVHQDYTEAELKCHSSCSPAGRLSYVWFRNGQKVREDETSSYKDWFHPEDVISCALKGHENYGSPSVCVHGQNCNRVTYTDRSICAFKGSSVDISCTFNSYDGSITSKFWFSPERSDQWQSPSQPEDLSEDSLYAGRVQVLETERGRSTLRIRDLRESDSAQYHFKFKTSSFEWSNISPGTTLTVTALQVQVKTISVHQYSTEAELKCHSSCSPAGRLSYVWFKNGQKVREDETSTYKDWFHPRDVISCALKGHENYGSPSVCVHGQNCNRVTYTDRNICASKGSSVDISCTFNSYDGSITSKFWFSSERSDQWQSPSQPEDLSEDSLNAGRVQVLETERGRSTLRIRDLRESDSAQYHFKFKTRSFEWSNISPGTTLTVTALQVQVNTISVQQYSTEAELKCHSSCSPAGRLSYVWFKNGQKVREDETSSYKGWFYPEDVISCALKGHENYGSPSVCVHGQNCNRVTYTDRNICAFKGSSVDISCTFNSYDGSITSKFWFSPERSDQWQSPSQPEDLSEDSLYAGRVQVLETERGRSTLRIRDLRESDSAQYHFKFKTRRFEWSNISPGTTLTVTGVNGQNCNRVTYTDRNICAFKGSSVDISCTYNSYDGSITSKFWFSPERSDQWQSPSQPEDLSEDSLYAGRVQVLETETGRSTLRIRDLRESDSAQYHFKFKTPWFEWSNISPGTTLTVTGVNGQNCNRVTYTDRNICAFKGSSVDISCTYNSYDGSITSKFWFSPERSDQWQSPSQPEDLSEDSLYAGRVQVLETETGRSTLRIRDLRESDSAQYHFKFITPWFEWSNISPGTTLTVTALQVQVNTISVHQDYANAELKCHSSCSPAGRLSYVWFKNGQKVREETSSYKDWFYPRDVISCALKGHENYGSPSVYPPRLPSVSVSPSAEIVENSSVTLTCSSDANPAAKYTWYKKGGDPDHQPLSKEAELVFRSIQSSDSGEYYCTTGNRTFSIFKYISISVKYPPKLPSVSVSPSAEIVENSSVTLTCSSDANPAAKYTWYKEKQKLPQRSTGIYHFTSISSEDRGNYYCKSENQHGQIDSSSLFIDVQYPPRLPSVSVSPSAEIVEGSSVNLTCSSDANPAAKYTWYKENENSPKASGQIFTITDFRPEHRGNYYCEAQNRRGRHNSTLHLIVVAGSMKSVAVGSITAIVLAIIFLCAFLLIRRKRSLKQTTERPDNNAQLNMGTVSDNHSAAVQRTPAEEQDDLCYASVRYSKQQEDPLYSNIRPFQPNRNKNEEQEEEDEGSVEYSVVKMKSGSASPEGIIKIVLTIPSPNIDLIITAMKPQRSVSTSGVHGQNCNRVTYTDRSICASKGSSVDISCTYNSYDGSITSKFWFSPERSDQWQSPSQPEDLSEDSLYAGRVQVLETERGRSTLRIRDLRESDSAQYHFKFKTPSFEWRSILPGTTLTVTALQVQVNTISVHQYSTEAELKCHSSCSPAGRLSYVWFKNGQKVREDETSSYKDWFHPRDFISCALKGHENYGSPSVCVHGQNCNRVTYTDRSICASKGSSVDISCTYNSYDGSITSKFWFSPERSDQWQSPSQPEDLSEDSLYAGRVQVLETERGRSTLRIRDLRESDSAQYHFKFKTSSFEWSNISPGTTLTVTDPPRLPSVSLSPSAEIVENSSVTLTCSSDANPAAKYTWYKKNEDPDPHPLSKEAELVFRSIQSSDSGEYYCTAENELGKRTSESISVNVKYPPKLPSVSVSPSAEIVENSSVTLTCSSDANPAAKYTWYKEKQKLPQRSTGIYHFTSISSEDRGNYYCKSENQYGQIMSSSLPVDVQYAPKLPSVSVSPSAEIVENSSVNLTCSSDANPAAKYTWYKENEDSPKASGQIFTITDSRPEHSGNYYCEAQNRRGRHNSTLHLIVVAGSMKSVAVGSITAIVLAIIFLCAFLLIRKKKSLKQTTERPDNNAQLNMGTVSDNHSAAFQRTPAEEQDDLCYASVRYSKQQEDPLYSNIRPVQPNRNKNEEQEEEDEGSVEYSVVKMKSGSASPE